ncbi:MAG: restriction endonuclease subunit S [Bacteroidota bacterium]|mgnify:CR=1 FL=1
MSEWKETDFGKIPINWEVSTLGNVCQLLTDGSHLSPKPIASGYYMASVKDMRYNHFDFSDCKTISKQDFDFLIKNNCSPKYRDLLLSKDGANCLDIIFVYRQEQEIVLLSSIAIARLKDGYNPDFYRYFLLSPNVQDIMRNNYVSGSAIPRVILKDFRNVPVPVVNYNIQTAIAEILSSLDDKIDLLHRQNKTLEQLAETLFRQWFEEEAEESWEVGTIADEFDFVMGQSPLGVTLNENQDGMIFFQGRTDFGYRFPTPRVYTTDPIRLARRFDTLVSVRAPVGDMNMSSDDCCLGRGVAAFRYEPDNSFYSYTYYKMRSLMGQIKQFEDSGTVFGSIGKDDFKELESVIPPRKLVEEFQNKTKSFDDKIYSNTTQIRTLTQLRDTLLPKLMSGEVRVN